MLGKPQDKSVQHKGYQKLRLQGHVPPVSEVAVVNTALAESSGAQSADAPSENEEEAVEEGGRSSRDSRSKIELFDQAVSDEHLWCYINMLHLLSTLLDSSECLQFHANKI